MPKVVQSSTNYTPLNQIPEEEGDKDNPLNVSIDFGADQEIKDNYFSNRSRNNDENENKFDDLVKRINNNGSINS